MRNTWLAAFTARTTRVSNPVCSPSFRPSPSDPSSCDAFATGGPLGIIAFYRYPQNTSHASRSQAKQCPLHAVMLSTTISQEIYLAGYERFRPNKNGPHLRRWCYRGGWHQSFPPLIRQSTYLWQKLMQYMSTWSPPVTLSCIAEVSRLLHPVGLGSVSQYPSPGYHSHGPYRSKAWWAITPPTT